VIDSVVSSFNNYVLEWDENKINTYINDKLIFSYLKNGQPWERWPFDGKFHFILNVAVGGNWGGKEGIDDKALPSKMEIDYFRVYKKKS
jgi:beta-glucanase (GH16 family)